MIVIPMHWHEVPADVLTKVLKVCAILNKGTPLRFRFTMYYILVLYPRGPSRAPTCYRPMHAVRAVLVFGRLSRGDCHFVWAVVPRRLPTSKWTHVEGIPGDIIASDFTATADVRLDSWTREFPAILSLPSGRVAHLMGSDWTAQVSQGTLPTAGAHVRLDTLLKGFPSGRIAHGKCRCPTGQS